jgi:hypothetical protein
MKVHCIQYVVVPCILLYLNFKLHQESFPILAISGRLVVHKSFPWSQREGGGVGTQRGPLLLFDYRYSKAVPFTHLSYGTCFGLQLLLFR